MRPKEFQPPTSLPTCCMNGSCAVHSAYLKQPTELFVSETNTTGPSIKRSASSSSQPRFVSISRSKSKSFAVSEAQPDPYVRPKSFASDDVHIGKSFSLPSIDDRLMSAAQKSDKSEGNDRHERENEVEEEEEEDDGVSGFILDTVYKRYVLKRNGNVRLKDLGTILTEAGIPFDTSRIVDSDVKLRGEFLMSLEEFRRLTSIVRLDVVIEDDLEARLYKVPEWLVDEFSLQEIAMFKHHFMVIDLDKGGSIDSSELQDLTESLGNRISEDEVYNDSYYLYLIYK